MWAYLAKAAWWGLKFIAKSFLWATAHPVTAALTGVVLATTSLILARQKWAGADLLARLVGGLGGYFFTVGMGTLIAQAVSALRWESAWNRLRDFALGLWYYKMEGGYI